MRLLRDKELLIILILVAVILTVTFIYVVRRPAIFRKDILILDRDISQLLKTYYLGKPEISVIKEYYVGRQFDVEEFRTKLESMLKKRGLRLLQYESKPEAGKDTCLFKVGKDRKVFYTIKFLDIKIPKIPRIVWKKRAAKIAIVIDDWGYNMNNIQLLNSINIPLTLAILPSLPYSKKIATTQHIRSNREIILHMPMEADSESVRLEKNTILTSMDKKEVLRLLAISLDTVSHAKGVSNHMGSKATQDKTIINTILDRLRKRRLYFLDSVATPYTVCEESAGSLRTIFIKRDIFLDNKKDDKGYIFSQMDKLIRLARQRGYAVGIGHSRLLTLQAIKERAQMLQSDNSIKFVLVSELLKR